MKEKGCECGGSRSGQGEAHSSLHALSRIRACGCGTTLDVMKWGGKLLTIVVGGYEPVLMRLAVIHTENSSIKHSEVENHHASLLATPCFVWSSTALEDAHKQFISLFPT